MGLIYWTDSLVNGDNVTQTHITNLKNDITTIVNGGITNSNVNASAAIAESKLAFDSSAGHDHDGSNSKTISSGANTHYIQGAELVYSAADKVYANPGVIEMNGSVYSRTAVSTVLDLDTAGDFLYGSRAVSTWYYIYAYNDSASSWDIKFSTQAPAYYNCDTGNTAGILRYRDYSSVWYRCIGAVKTDATGSGNILNFFQDDEYIAWDVPQLITDVTPTTDATGLNHWSDALSCGVGIPGISTRGYFKVAISNNASNTDVGGSLRPNGSTKDTPDGTGTGNDDGDYYVYHSGSLKVAVMSMTDATQQIQHYAFTGGTLDNYSIFTLAYWLNIR